MKTDTGSVRGWWKALLTRLVFRVPAIEQPIGCEWGARKVEAVRIGIGRWPKQLKDIYLYPLESDFRLKMGLSADSGLSALKVADGLGADQWAEKEFGGAPLGDKRLSIRLVESAGAKASQPDRAFCGVAEADWAAVKGYYRFIDHPDETAVNMENILVPHRERTIRRMKAQKTVLCIQDGSDLDYSKPGPLRRVGCDRL